MRPVRCALLIAIALVFAVPLYSSATASHTQGAETAAQFYLRWRHVVLTATSSDEIAPFFDTQTRDELSMASPADRADMLAAMKRGLGMETDVTVVQETPTATGATLSLAGVGPDKQPLVGAVDVVKESGVWKIGNAVERWKPRGEERRSIIELQS